MKGLESDESSRIVCGGVVVCGCMCVVLRSKSRPDIAWSFAERLFQRSMRDESFSASHTRLKLKKN